MQPVRRRTTVLLLAALVSSAVGLGSGSTARALMYEAGGGYDGGGGGYSDYGVDYGDSSNGGGADGGSGGGEAPAPAPEVDPYPGPDQTVEVTAPAPEPEVDPYPGPNQTVEVTAPPTAPAPTPEVDPYPGPDQTVEVTGTREPTAMPTNGTIIKVPEPAQQGGEGEVAAGPVVIGNPPTITKKWCTRRNSQGVYVVGQGGPLGLDLYVILYLNTGEVGWRTLSMSEANTYCMTGSPA